MPIDCRAVADGFFAAAEAAPSVTHAARALDPLVASLRASLILPRSPADPEPVLRLVSLPPLAGGEGARVLADRLRMRLDEIAMAKRWGDAADVQRVLDVTIGELRQAALGAAGGKESHSWDGEFATGGRAGCGRKEPTIRSAPPLIPRHIQVSTKRYPKSIPRPKKWQ
ncbi:MAG: hypothetical protein WCR51_04345 [Planctomycetia bacterium]